MKQHKAGIYKGVSEAVYPNDLLGDQELQGAPLDVRGAWCANILPALWRDKAHTITAPVPAFARRWGVDIQTAERIIADIETHKIGDVSRDCPGVVSITCRRLKRKAEQRQIEKDKKARQRCPGNVPAKKVLPSSSLSSSPSVPVGVDSGEPAPASPPEPDHEQPPGEDAYAEDDRTQKPASVNLDMTAITNLSNQLMKRGNGGISFGQARQQIIQLLGFFEDGKISEAITALPVGCKPWELADALNGRAGPPGGNGAVRKSFDEQAREKVMREAGFKIP